MAKVRVPILGTIGKSVRVDPDATIGGTLGLNLFAADGTLLSLGNFITTEQLQALIINGGAGVSDHGLLTSIGVNTHTQIDTHIGTGNIHFADAPVDSQDYVRNNNAWVVPTETGFQGYGIWRYRTTTTGTPSAGRLEFDDLTIDNATEMYLNEVNDGGTNIAAFLDLLVPEDILYVQVQVDSSQFVIVRIGAPSKAADVYTFPILNIEGQGAGISNNTRVAVVGTSSGSSPALALRTRGITIENPTAADNFVLFFTDVAITIQQLNFVLRGATSVTAFLRFGPDRSAAGTNVITLGTVVSNTTTGQEFTSFDNAAIPAGSWVWIATTALVGTPNSVNLSVVFN